MFVIGLSKSLCLLIHKQALSSFFVCVMIYFLFFILQLLVSSDTKIPDLADFRSVSSILSADKNRPILSLVYVQLNVSE